MHDDMDTQKRWNTKYSDKINQGLLTVSVISLRLAAVLFVTWNRDCIQERRIGGNKA